MVTISVMEVRILKMTMRRRMKMAFLFGSVSIKEGD
jgi:hypothetical protein